MGLRLQFEKVGMGQRLHDRSLEPIFTLRIRRNMHRQAQSRRSRKQSNLRSIHLLNKVGFLREGIQVSKNFSNGKFNDMMLMAYARERFIRERNFEY